MGLLKRLSRSNAIHAAGCFIIAMYIRLCRWTSRWRVEGTADRDRLYAEGKPFIIALWHNRIGMMPYAYAEQSHNLCVVASAHRDGMLVVRSMGHFGFDGIPIDSKAAAKATRLIVRRLKEGGHVGITPDGPRGPRMRVKDGIIQIAALAGVPIVPVSYAMKRRKVLGSWDMFHLPLPFNTGICRWGKPIEVPRGSDMEAIRLHLERTLIDMSDECDKEMGNEPTPPAAPEPGKADSMTPDSTPVEA